MAENAPIFPINASDWPEGYSYGLVGMQGASRECCPVANAPVVGTGGALLVLLWQVESMSHVARGVVEME